MNTSTINKLQLILAGLTLFVLTACGGGSKTQQSGSGSDTDASVPSPNGETGQGSSSGLSGLITIDSSDSGNYQGIYSFKLSNGKATSQGVLEAMGSMPARHPKGKMVFRKSCGSNIEHEISILGTNGITTPITPCITELRREYIKTIPYYVALPYYERATLSPDESLIAVGVSYRGGYSGDEDKSFILVFDMSGQVRHRYDDAYDPTWLPDGRLLIVSTVNDGDGMKITDKSLNNPTLINNTPLGSRVDHVAISPSGKQLVFVYNYQIWIMNIDGSGLKRLIAGNGRMKAPTWSPDGKYIAYFTSDHEGLIYGYHRKINFLELNSNKTYILLTDGNVFKDKGAFSKHPRGPISWTN